MVLNCSPQLHRDRISCIFPQLPATRRVFWPAQPQFKTMNVIFPANVSSKPCFNFQAWNHGMPWLNNILFTFVAFHQKPKAFYSTKEPFSTTETRFSYISAYAKPHWNPQKEPSKLTNLLQYSFYMCECNQSK